MMKLHGPILSNNVQRPLLIARHLGLAVETVPVDMVKGEHKSDAYRALNPHGRIPVLVDGDYALWESEAIIHYLAAQKPDAIYPDDLKARSTILSWVVWGIAHLSRGISPVQFNRFFKPLFGMGEIDEVAVMNGLATYQAEAAVLEDRLEASTSGWLVGDGLTVADYDIAGWFLHAEAVALPVMPHTAQWLARVTAQPAWEASLKG